MPLLKSLLKEKEQSHSFFSITDNLDDADFVILPMSWNYYYTNNLVAEVLRFYKSVPNTEVASFVFGDFSVKVPKEFKGIVFRNTGLKSRLPENNHGLPVFIDDPLIKYFSRQDVIAKEVTDLPVVGFCGQARGFGLHSIKEILRTVYKNSLSMFGLSQKDLEMPISTSHLRFKLLSLLEKSSKVKSNFVLRNAYRAGVKENKEFHPTTLQFYNNIVESDYIVCVRGAGNFSTRFYETLAMGRIPVFVNTDCFLPLEDKIKWKEHVVWVEYDERHQIAEKVSEFHAKHDESSLNELFLANRKLWEEYLQLYHFFNASLNEYKKASIRN